MKTMPVLYTERLILRPFDLKDATHVQLLAGDADIAASTGNIPHPYDDGIAEAWIKTHGEEFDRNISLTLAVVQRAKKTLSGAVSLFNIDRRHNRAELGYWIGKPYWNNGFCTEAAAALVSFGFENMKLNKIYAAHFDNNPASGRVMKKLGMKKEGFLRENVRKNNVYRDQYLYALPPAGVSEKEELFNG